MINTKIYEIESIQGLEVLNKTSVNQENLLVKLDGTTLRITERSWFSMSNQITKKMSAEVMKILQAKPATNIEPDMPAVVQLLRQQIIGQIVSYRNQTILPGNKAERFVAEIIRFISLYFGWGLSAEDNTALLEVKEKIDSSIGPSPLGMATRIKNHKSDNTDLMYLQFIGACWNHEWNQSSLIQNIVLKNDKAKFIFVNEEGAEKFKFYINEQLKVNLDDAIGSTCIEENITSSYQLSISPDNTRQIIENLKTSTIWTPYKN